VRVKNNGLKSGSILAGKLVVSKEGLMHASIVRFTIVNSVEFVPFLEEVIV